MSISSSRYYLPNMYFTNKILSSYNTRIGMAIIVCEKTSGVGEMTAPTTKDMTSIIFRLPIRYADVITPILAKTTKNNGNSKTTPKGSKKETTKEKYWPIEKSGCNSAVENPTKNLIPAGKTKK